MADGADRIELERSVGHSFARPALLDRALSHRSWCAENLGHDSNERLEFLGDSVLGLVVTTEIFDRFPDLPEGELAKIRASVVSEPALAEAARGLGLGQYIRLGNGEDADGGRDKDSILSDAMEAVLGAMWLDGAADAVTSLVLETLAPGIAIAAAAPGVADHKTRLQEVAAQRGFGAPRYVLQGSGPDHARHFEAEVWIDQQVAGRGTGPSKKRAEQAAAEAANRFINDHDAPAPADSVASRERASEDVHA